MEKPKMSRIEIIKTFFELEGGPKVTIAELKNSSRDDREELAQLASIELGVEVSS
jgi:hypothetical protein